MNTGSNKMVMRPPKIKNKTPNPIQTTAEQLLKDAQAHQHKEVKPPQQRIKDEDELEDYKLRKRKEFEDSIRKQRFQMGTWIKYAQWEESLQEFRRARSVYERALDIDYKNISLWLKYAEMEMKHKFINHARNIWERACTYLPRIDQFWYKYSYMEEILGNYNRAREVMERWMTWKPEEKAWLAYLKFEERMGEIEKKREIMYRYLQAYPRLRTFLKVAQFEMKNKNKAEARAVFEKALEDLGQEAMKEELFLAFAKFEIRSKEVDRARQIYNFGLENIPKEKAFKLYESYLSFEKQHGSKEEIDILIINKRRIQYKEILSKNPHNYDAWFDLIYLELSTKDQRRIRETFEAAVENKPPAEEKRFWRRYIYLWYNYAVFEELDAADLIKSKDVYDRMLKIVPHEKFTFKKLWNMTAHFYIRCKNIDKARKVYGMAIGRCPREMLFESYIEMEMQLSNIDRCRTLFEKYIEIFPESPRPWIKYAEMEKQLDELDRYRSIFELAINQASVNEPESVWKSYIENEISLGEIDRTRDIYQKLLDRTKHVKMWISYALFESTQGNELLTRRILRQADDYFKENIHLKEERVMLYEAWLEIEKKFGDPDFLEIILKKMPQKVKRRKEIKIQEGDVMEEAGIEEYYDYIFPEDRTIQYSKILEKAHAWKKNVSGATPSTEQD